MGQALAAQEISAVVGSSLVATISSPRGGPLAALPVGLGQKVRAGDLLAEFECATQRAELAVSEAEAKIAAIEANSQRRLVANGAGGRAALAQAIARQELQNAKLDIAKAEISRCKVLAPFEGAISNITVRLYETIDAGAPLLELVDTQDLQLEVIVPSEYISRLQIGLGLSFEDTATGRLYGAKITKIAPKIDGVSQTIRIIAKFEDGADLPIPGVAGIVRFK